MQRHVVSLRSDLAILTGHRRKKDRKTRNRPQSLAKSELLPSEHLVDMGYTGCRMLVDSQQRHGVVIVGPVVEDTS